MRKVKSILLAGTMLILIIMSSYVIKPERIKSIEPFFTIVATSRFADGDYLNLLAYYLAEIGIKVDAIFCCCGSIDPTIKPTFCSHYDIAYFTLTTLGIDTDFTGVYSENGSLNLNIFGYDTSMDWNETLGTGTNEWYLKQGNLIMPPNSDERIQHYWEWEQYLMDEILPCIPMFTPKSYVAHWATLDGYDYIDGIPQSWGRMNWTAPHREQQSTKELVIADVAWSNLNPLFQEDSSSAFISSATMDPLVYFDTDMSAWPHLATSWEYRNDTWVRVHLREGVKWQADPDGSFSDEYFDAEDVYFTFYSWKYLTNNSELYSSLKKMEIIDQHTIDFYIDGNPATPENEPYAPYFSMLNTLIIPEHYLNQTQLPDGKTPDITHQSWAKFASHCFGTGILLFDSFKKSVETQLTLFDDCWRMDPNLLNDSDLDWERRFGNKWALEKLRIRIIPCIEEAFILFETGWLDIQDCTNFPHKRNQYLSDPNLEIQSDIQFSLGCYVFNLEEGRTPLGSRDPSPCDPNMTIGLAIRKAIAYAINREEMNNLIHGGEYVINNHPIYMKMGFWCNPNIIHYNYDLNKARKYMQMASICGCPETSSEIRTNPSITIGLGLWVPTVSLLIVSIFTLYLFKKRKQSNLKCN